MTPLLASVLVAVAVAGAVGLTIEVLRVAWERQRASYLSRDLRTPGEVLRFIDRGSLRRLSLAAAGLAGLLGALVGGALAGVVLAAAGLFGVPWAVGWYRRRWLSRLERQLLDALVALSGALRAGLTFAQGVDQVARDAPAPLGQELQMVGKELRLGVGLDTALAHLSDRVGSEDLSLVATACRVSLQTGGNLAETLEVLAATVAERLRLEGRVEALTAQGRLQGWVLAAMPLVLGVVMNLLRPDLMQPMLHHTFGTVVVGAALVSESLGLWMIRRLVAIDL